VAGTLESTIKQYILDEFLPGEDPNALLDTTPLISGGILDSLATLRLVAYLEEQFSIQIQAHETGIEYLNSINDIANLVNSKL
jgi:acyl carrier protein